MAEGGFHGPGDLEGRTAERPTDIPARGWKRIAGSTWRKMSDDNVGFVAAALAYYSVFAVFPALAATLSLWGLFADPKVIEGQLADLSGSLPPDIAKMIQGQLSAVAGASGGALGFAAIVSVLVAVYSASKGMTGLMSGLNVVYAEKEGRGFVKRTLTSLALTFGGVLMVVVAIALLAVLPPVLAAVGLGGATSTLLEVGRWPLLALGMFAFLAVLYRYAPSRTKARWAWTTPGALLATAVWLVGSALFTLYVTMFGKFNETYGALGAAIVLLLWLWVSGYAFLLGGELNAELERHTERDTTAGPPRPMGERGAFMADHLPDPR